MEFKKISAPSLKDLFIRELESSILSGKLAVGEKLPPERELADSMNVSRAVVNAGVVELARRGFLVIKPRVGTFVADYRRDGNFETLASIMNYNGGKLRSEEIKSILELAIAVDIMALRLSIDTITPEEIGILTRYAEELRSAQTPEEAAGLVYNFQHEFAILSGNTLIPLIISSFKVPITTLWQRYFTLYGAEVMYENNIGLCQLIQARDLEGAEAHVTHVMMDSIHGNRPIYY
ncbi:MAG: GntR family transcriptional regulator [Hespellia sp.]|nr:GntR family transcriptional regulator [Hespellia sp.]